MPPKVIRIVNGEIREVDEEPPPQQPRRTVVNGQASDSEDDGPRSSEDVIAQRLFGASSSSRGSPTFDLSKPPLSVAWEDRARSLAGLPGLSVFGAHLSSRWLVALAVATAAAGLKGLLISAAVWALYKLGFEGEASGSGATGPGGHRLGAHPHSGALPARALASYLAAAGGGRAAATATAAGTTQATAAGGAAAGAAGAGGGTVGGSAGAASSSAAAKKSSEDVRNATRKAWAAREAAVAAAKAAAAAANESRE